MNFLQKCAFSMIEEKRYRCKSLEDSNPVIVQFLGTVRCIQSDRLQTIEKIRLKLEALANSESSSCLKRSTDSVEQINISRTSLTIETLAPDKSEGGNHLFVPFLRLPSLFSLNTAFMEIWRLAKGIGW